MQLFWHTSFWPLLTLDRMPSLDRHRDGPAALLDKYVNLMCVCVCMRFTFERLPQYVGQHLE